MRFIENRFECKIYLQETMPNYTAFETAGLKEFTIKHRSSEILCSGQMKGWDDNHLFIEIFDGFEMLMSCCDDEFFNVNFIINRSTFQLQHNAISWMKKHDLFSVLINNPLYDREYHASAGFSTAEGQFR